jgi:uncharacterized membrane protein HdeD (DUF308 family)
MNGMLKMAVIAADERETLRRSWAWFVALGVLFAALGFAGLVFVGLTSLLSVLFVGWFFLISGTVGVIHAIIRRGWSGFWLDLVSGVITALAGLFIVLHPLAGASVLTIIIGLLFLVGGIFRLGAGVAMRNPYAGWVLLHGAVSALLGIFILAEWPNSLVWVIGTLVAVDLIIDGVRLISFGLAAKHLPEIGGDDERTPHAAAPPAAPPA